MSILHHFFTSAALEWTVDTHVRIQLDNCGGQFKNNMLLWYLAWAVAQDWFKAKCIVLAFMIPGHSKFRCDAYIGLVKARLARTAVYSPEQFIEMSTAHTGGKVTGNIDGVEYRDWNLMLRDLFRNRKVDQLQSFRQFRFQRVSPGRIFYRKMLNEQWNANVLDLMDAGSVETRTRTIRAAPVPAPLEPGFVDSKRQWEIYNNIRPFLPENLKDVLAPKPSERLKPAPEKQQRPSKEPGRAKKRRKV